ncbi:adenylate/guanylate cyclase domain-containing protein [Mesorhizobium sp. LHD-90]|uniref:CHASE2 domain-containing protein n=1 Tax=Mesorhizobium sp. LHD-90 TaxID=3071414 RepID=UPI0027DF94EE|nr:adenylate/guanylate cyclase domain-containing protein [Mesorhizobium sp. LHD-90]MDQ6434504.1 adenylate/guanylate cyclase domain-containing protein [Mesorhizobium sp. LHD-90]
MRPRFPPVVIALLLAGLWGAVLAFTHLNGGLWFLDRVEATMADIRLTMRGPKPAPDLLTIVAIDDDTAQVAGGYPLPRAALARLVGEIARHKPKAIAIDVLLVDPGPGDGDAQLAQALRTAPTVLAAAAVFPDKTQAAPGGGPLANVPVAQRLLLPLPVFAESAAIGVVNVATDQAGTPRAIPLLFRTGDRIEMSLPLRTAAIATGSEPALEPGSIVVGGNTIRTDVGRTLPLAFYGPQGTIRTVSAAEVLSGGGADQLAGRIVVIGATVTGGGDVFPTPFDPVLPGVEVISTAILHLTAGDGLVRDHATRLADAALAFVLPVAVVGLLAWRRNAAGLISAAALLVLALAANVLAFGQGFWLSAALPMAAAAPPALLFGAAQLWLGRRSASLFARQSELLQRIQAPGLGQWLAHNPDFLAEPVRQDAAVVFIDLSGFTGLSETLGPTATRELLDAFYGLVADEASAHGGAVTAFTGDGAMILFGLPQPAPQDAANAARCCARLSERVGAWIASLPRAVVPRLDFKIGAHFGEVVASRLGHGDNQQITVTGDTVNVANRLMEVAARQKMPVAVSDALLKAAGREAFSAGRLDGPTQAALRGRAEPLAAWVWRDGSAEQVG